MKKRSVRSELKMNKGFFKEFYFKELLDIYLAKCKESGLVEETCKGYEYATDYFLRFAGEELKCKEVTQQLVDDYKLWLSKERGLKAESVNSYQFIISPIIHYGFESGYITDRIDFKRVFEQEHFKEIYSHEELVRLLRKPSGNSFTEYRTWVIINLLVSTGIRAKELRMLKIKSVDLNNRMLILDHTKNKVWQSIKR